MRRGLHCKGAGEVLSPSTKRFYATTGLPFKASGDIPLYLRYLQSPAAKELSYLSDGLILVARNALMEMLDYLIEHHGLTREQTLIFNSGSGGRIRTYDLRVMSPTSCLTAPPRN